MDASIGYPKNKKDDTHTTNKRNGYSRIQVSADMVSKITDRILPEVKEWQTRPLEPIYTFCFLDAIHYAYLALGVRLDGTKDILSITVGANESSKFWLGMLNGDTHSKGSTYYDVYYCVHCYAVFH